MRFLVSLSLVVALFLTSCANQGVIVQKESRPFPFYHSIGEEGLYTFHVRDSSGSIRRQLVTPDVFELYATGDYFNDLQPSSGTASEPKEMRAAYHAPANSARLARKTPRKERSSWTAQKRKKSSSKIATARQRKRSRSVAKKSVKKETPVARHAPTREGSKRPVVKAAAKTPAQESGEPLVFINDLPRVR